MSGLEITIQYVPNPSTDIVAWHACHTIAPWLPNLLFLNTDFILGKVPNEIER